MATSGDDTGGPEAEHSVIVENTPDVHNLVVCTLCSCYPWPVLGLPPTVQVAAVLFARGPGTTGVARRDGNVVPDDVEIRVWDSSADVRYLVLPQRPADTEALAENELAALVTREAMIGVERL